MQRDTRTRARVGLATATALVVVAATMATFSGRADSAPDPTPPPGFYEEVVVSGLTFPTAVRFSPDGRIFVAEKDGLIKVFDGPGDTTPVLFADLRRRVFGFSDRGLLGLELHPDFPANPSVYVLYSHDAPIGGTAPTWSQGGINDDCPSPPAPSGDGCVTSSRLSRLTANGSTWTGTETVLIEDWCQQYEGHSIGTVTFGNDGMLYAGAGEGALASTPDWGQRGGVRGAPNPPTPRNPCGDPPGGVGGVMVPPNAEGGSLRSQDLRTPGDPQTLDGTIIRVNPNTGAAAAGNPMSSSSNANVRRIVAYGLRNPFRFVARPGTDELWLADVGLKSAEEINVLRDTNDGTVENFGWPCYEGNARQAGFDAADLNLCESLYSSGGQTPPYFQYTTIGGAVVPGEQCPTGKGAISGITFYEGGAYPDVYDGALFFTDYTRQCIWVMPLGDDGEPDRSQRRTFLHTSGFPVDLQIGPGGDVYYADIMLGRVVRVAYSAGNRPPKAVLNSNVRWGSLPLTVRFDATASSDPDPGDRLTYAWDLDGDGAFDDSTASRPTRTYTSAKPVTVRVRVRDRGGATAVASRVIYAGDRPPTVRIKTPVWKSTARGNVAVEQWVANATISFGAVADDPEEGRLPKSRVSWQATLHHCSAPGDCHAHPHLARDGATSGSFTAPDHEYPAYLELTVRARDRHGLTARQTVILDPMTLDITFTSSPNAVMLTVDDVAQRTPFTRRVIVGTRHVLSAASPQGLRGRSFTFSHWSDGGARTHTVTARRANPRAYHATFLWPGQPG
jgi:glucose/arabinose dehydrogenase